MARDTWTDERLDDLNRKVDAGFTEMHEEFRATRREIDGVRQEVGSLRDSIEAMQRSFNQIFAGLIGTMLVGFLGIIAALLAQT